MAKLRKEGRLGNQGQVRLVPLGQAISSLARKADKKHGSTPKSPAAPKMVKAKTDSAIEKPWGLETLYRIFADAGVERKSVDEMLARYKTGRGPFKREMGPLLIHEPFVQTALERGENVPREILELYPKLLPEANLLHGVKPGSRDAILLQEAKALYWINFHDSREYFSANGRWYIGSNPQYWHRADVTRTALEALQKAWGPRSAIEKNSYWGVLDQGGPWTVAEQRKRVMAERKRLEARYQSLGLKAPMQPVALLDEWRKREAEVVHGQEQETLGYGPAMARRRLRDANAANARREYELDSSRFARAAPVGDPDARTHWRSGVPDTKWANNRLNAALVRLSNLKTEDVQSALADADFSATIDPYVVKKFKREFGGSS